ncbi:MAG TPA: hypothetical protein VE999_19885 [Gemmataceae bacterium]|nr:hypothetical protein [Gemmataceae bacterium]
MNASSDAALLTRRWVYILLIVLAAGMAVGRILSVELVYEPSLSQSWPDDPDHPRRAWPATAPRAMPTFSSNDRSRWAAVRALVDEGTWVVGRRDKQVVLGSAPAALAARDPLQLTVLLEAGYEQRIRSDRGIIFEDGWGSVDKMLNPATLEFYSTKPPLLTCLVAGEYWLLNKLFGWSLSGTSDHRFSIVRVCLLTFNLLPFVVSLWLLTRLVERFGSTDWGRLFVVAAACFGTLMTPFLITLNNHTLATCSLVVAVYAAVRIQSDSPESWRWFVIAGFFAGFTAANELPAAAFAVGLGLLLFVRFPRRTVLGFAPAALVPVAAMLMLNYAELGEWQPGYSKFGTEWYEYEGSHWRNLPDNSKRGIDWAKNKETKGAYAFHLLVGHHGWFSLTPIYLLGLGGMGLGMWYLIRAAHAAQRSKRQGQPLTPLRCVRGSAEMASRQWAELAVSTALVSLVVIGYYIYKSDNYGGWSNGPRWLMWLSPLWLLTLLPFVDRLGQRRWGRVLCLVLLAPSVLSAHYTDWNAWRQPWIYNWMDSRGWIPY